MDEYVRDCQECAETLLREAKRLHPELATPENFEHMRRAVIQLSRAVDTLSELVKELKDGR